MITNLKFNNCFAFNKEIEMDLLADRRIKKFPSNLYKLSKFSVLKSAVIYGPNNTGKTCLINCVKAIKNTLLNQHVYLRSNIFNKNDICEQSISFLYNKKIYTYEYKFNSIKRLYLYEKLSKKNIDKYFNEKEELIYIKDTINEIYKCPKDIELEKILSITSNDNILIYTVKSEKFFLLQKIKEILTSIANSIEIIDMNNIPNEKTIEMLKSNNNETKKIVNFIKKADLYLDDYRYVESPASKFVDNKYLAEQMKLISVYKGHQVPSILFDSLGTKKFASIASYIIDAIENGKTLFIDELDSSLHFKITRAIFSMFNNDSNVSAQLIATLHDVSLLDCKKMFRKEQIWFTDRDDKETKLYSLKIFNYEDKGIRETTDIREKYSKGVFGALPDPNLVSALLEDFNKYDKDK